MAEIRAHAWRPVRRPATPIAAALVPLAASLVAAEMIVAPATFRLGLAAIVALLGLSLAFTAPRHLLLAIVIWLAVLGLIRRLATEVASPTHADPLLLVAPLALALLVLAPLQRRRPIPRTHLSSAVLALALLTLLGAVNPLGGSVSGGVAGLLFVLVPILGFWIGREIDDSTLERLLRLVGVVAVGAAVYGLAQTFLGFPSWDRHWIRDVGYGALSVGGEIRPFGSFSSAAEYAVFLGIGFLALVGFARARPEVGSPRLALAALVGVALILESSRGIVVLVLAALGVMAAARRRLPFRWTVPAAAIFVVLGGLVASHFAPSSQSATGTGALLSHQLKGLADPTDPESSTLVLHLSLVGNGIADAFRHPIGLGVGTVTIAGEKFGGLSSSTEADPSNVAVALGLPGLLAYSAVFFLGFRRVYRVAAERGDALAAVAVGLLVATLFQWLNGGQYAVAFLPWLVLGWADRAAARASDAGRELPA